MIHAYDRCRAHVEWDNLHHHACTEVRASHLSGECHALREWERFFFGVSNHFKQCIRRRAIMSVRFNPTCQSDEQAERAVDEVLDICMKDTEPFGVAP
jgi:mitochondrial inner membrane protease ATP23